MPLTSGARLGPYEVVAALGAGGMGEVYRARDVRLARMVAIKVLPASTAGDRVFRERFEREARAASALNHPNILTVFDVGREADADYLITELVEGVTLRERLADGALQLRDIVDLGAQIADGLAAAHAAGLVHRDLKPDNVMVTRDGRVKILDFGLAKSTQEDPAGLQTQTGISQTGLLVGTIGYVAPEQIRGLSVDARADLFALGVVLYELATGTRAFNRATAVETLNAILNESVPDLPDTLPVGLRQIVAHCLEKEPARRFQSASDVAFALRSFASASGVPVPLNDEARATGRRSWLAWAIVPAGAALIAAGMAIAGRVSRPSTDLAAIELSPFAVEEAREWQPAIAPDGKTIAYVRTDAGDADQIVVKTDQSPTPTVLARGLFAVRQLFWSRMGDRLYFLQRGSTLSSVSAVGGEIREEARNVSGAALAPDGKTFAVVRANPTGGEGRLFTGPLNQLQRYEPSPVNLGLNCDPNVLRFSPDGTKILMWFSCADIGMFIVPAPDGQGRGGARRAVFAERADNLVSGADWLNDSQHVVFSSKGNLWLGDTETGRLERITTGTAPAWMPSVSRDGTIAFVELGIDHEVVELPIEGGSPRMLVSSSRYDGSPAWSPVGDRLAYVADRGRGDEVWTRTTADPVERRLVVGSDFPNHPPDGIRGLTFSPDGQWLALMAFNAAPSFVSGIWIVPVTGGPPRLITAENTLVNSGSWSPDGRAMAVIMSREKDEELWIFGVGTSAAPRRIDVPPDLRPWSTDWSPSDAWIAVQAVHRNDEQRWRTLLVDPTSGRIRMLPPLHADTVTWSRDSRTLYGFPRDQPGVLQALDVAGGAVRVAARYTPAVVVKDDMGATVRLSLDPTGRKFVSTAYVDRSNIWLLKGLAAPR